MPNGFDSAYTYARVSGSLARSYLGERALALAMSPRVGEAWRSIFGEPPPAQPEATLADMAERALRPRAMEAIRPIAGNLLREEPFFAALTRRLEFAYVKVVLAAVSEGLPEAPPIAEGGFAPAFLVEAYPDLESMLAGTRYRWVIESGLEDLPAVKNRLDRQYYAELWATIPGIPSWLRGSIRDLVRLEAELENLIWGLRLKRYYSMGAIEIEPLLIELKGIDIKSQALRAVARRPDSRGDWAGWKWERLIADWRSEEGGNWHFDLRGFESAARDYLFHKLVRRLHQEQDTYVPLYAYFRIKEIESTAMRGIIEGIKLEAPASEIGILASESTGGRA